MWTEDKLKEAAEVWERKWYQKHLEDIVCGKNIPSRKDAFLAGCKYIISNTQKDETK